MLGDKLAQFDSLLVRQTRVSTQLSGQPSSAAVAPQQQQPSNVIASLQKAAEEQERFRHADQLYPIVRGKRQREGDNDVVQRHAVVAGHGQKKKKKKKPQNDPPANGGGEQKDEIKNEEEEEDDDEDQPKPRQDQYLDDDTRDEIRNNKFTSALWEFIEMLAGSDRTRLKKTHRVAYAPLSQLWDMDQKSERYARRMQESLNEDNFGLRFKYYITPEAQAAIEEAYGYVKGVRNPNVNRLGLWGLLSQPELRTHFLGLAKIQLQRSLDPTAYRSASTEAIRTLNAIEGMHYVFFQTAIPERDADGKIEFRGGQIR